MLKEHYAITASAQVRPLRKAITLPALLTFLATTMIATPSLSAPMTIRGVNPDLTLPQVISAIENRGGICTEIRKVEGGDSYVQDCWSDQTLADDPKARNIIIFLTPSEKFESIIFQCKATNSCELGPGAVIRSLIDSEIIPASALDDWNKPGTPLSRELRFLSGGPGELTYTNEAGDKLHVQNTPDGVLGQYIGLRVSKEKLEAQVSPAFD